MSASEHLGRQFAELRPTGIPDHVLDEALGKHNLWDAPVRPLPPVLHTSQSHYEPEVVEHYRRGTNPPDEELLHGRPVHVAVHQGKSYLLDGHHRVRAGYRTAHTLQL